MKIVMTMLFIVMMSLAGFSQKEMPKDSPCATQSEARYYLRLADPDLKAAVWRGQLTVIRNHPATTAPQRAYLDQLIPQIVPGVYDGSVERPWSDEDIVALFGRDVRFVTLSPENLTYLRTGVGVINHSELPDEGGRPTCECSSESDWCGWGWEPRHQCKTAILCNFDFGCGTLGGYACNGMCG